MNRMSDMSEPELQVFIGEKAEDEAGYAIAYAILKLSENVSNVAVHLKYLGNGDASTTMGAIEAFGMHIGEKIDNLTNAISTIAEVQLEVGNDK